MTEKIWEENWGHPQKFPSKQQERGKFGDTLKNSQRSQRGAGQFGIR